MTTEMITGICQICFITQEVGQDGYCRDCRDEYHQRKLDEDFIRREQAGEIDV